MAKYQINKIGILGGTFDPPHKGHLAISKIALKKLKLEKVYWIITKKNPFKQKTYYTLKERLKKIKKILKKIEKIEVLYLDKKLNSSRSIDIIKFIRSKKKPKNLYFLIGSDILTDFHNWKSWKKIVKLVKLIVFSRKGYDKKISKTIVVNYINKKNIIFINNKPIKISSTLLIKKMKKTD